MPLLSELITKKPRYRLREKWKPDFESELKLAVSGFYADDAFHHAFGDGSRLNEKSILWHFIGLIINRRFSPRIWLVTVCKDKKLVAFLAGGLNVETPKFVEFLVAWMQELILKKVTPIKGKHEQNYQVMRDYYGAIENKEMEQRIAQYFDQVRNVDDMPDNVPLYFLNTMIAVDPEERGLGHLRAMLEKLLETLKENPQVEYVLVSTYDKSKVEMYEQLGVFTVKKLDNNITKAWVLKLSLDR